jgi:signal peptidase I
MKNKKPMTRTVLLILAVTFVILFKAFIMNKVIVSGDSMANTFINGDVLWVNKTADINTLKRFDIVVMETHSKAVSKKIIKRIVGLPNETVLIKDGMVYIDGEALLNDYGEHIIDSGIATIPVTLNDDEYFVMGDNRNASIDSRNALIGIINKSDIEGKIFFQIFPLNKIRKVD